MWHIVLMLAVLVPLNVLIIMLPQCSCTPLDDYVNKPDPNFKYNVITSFKGADFTTFVLNMTSQQWMTESFVDRSIWWHYVYVSIPDKLTVKDTALLVIDGGHNTARVPTIKDKKVELTATFAVGTGAIAIDLSQIPNEPVVFKNDPRQKSRTEDAIIAWTWSEYFRNTSNPEILLRLPMTKAAVRAMDAVADFTRNISGVNLVKFIVTGASKRGWATWTTAAVDKRVIAFVPIVMDELNFVQNLHHHFRSLGGWTFEFKDYYDVNFTASLDEPAVKAMADIIDPLVYAARYKNKPKLVISAGGDEFFLPDDSHYYWQNITEPKYIRMIPNAEHSCFGHFVDILLDISSFFLSVVTGKPLPKMSWTREQTSTGGRITLVTDTAPTQITARFAKTLTSSDGRRDFRLFIGTPGDPTKPKFHFVPWLYKDVKKVGMNTYQVEFDRPPKGWLAFFIETAFAGVGGTTLIFTTETMIIPDTFPFPDCHGKACRGTLV